MYGNREEDQEKDDGIRVISYGRGGITLANLKQEEVENLEAMVHNHFWVTVTDGRLETIRRKKDLPGPADDEELLPFWRREKSGTGQVELFEVNIPQHQSPSIIIQHLCGHHYTPENYKRQAEFLESLGFECLRSRRGADARFYEIWLLPGLLFARGALKETMENVGFCGKKELDKAVKFLCRNVSFGTLDVSYQMAAMRNPE